MGSNVKEITELVNDTLKNIIEKLDVLAETRRDISVDISNMIKVCSYLNMAVINTCTRALVSFGSQDSEEHIRENLYGQLHETYELCLQCMKSEDGKRKSH